MRIFCVSIMSHMDTLGECVCLGNDGDEVDTCTETLHDLNVERLESMAGRPDEVETSVDTKITLLAALWLLLLDHVGLMLVVNEVDDG